jgi:hypothetical protein
VTIEAQIADKSLSNLEVAADLLDAAGRLTALIVCDTERTVQRRRHNI